MGVTKHRRSSRIRSGAFNPKGAHTYPTNMSEPQAAEAKPAETPAAGEGAEGPSKKALKKAAAAAKKAEQKAAKAASYHFRPQKENQS
ncbi:hypothetical protein MAPG_02045 [Magnaporthiopsis poae ATCC 64411]|uniref:Uncharacterized protein n=1 Tax=Magnaporthiopsis poae (strain ATCC 64411 / 73-15) TaxID=644358 RepID=A0A0C4DQA7_MAGP6|nr:hypothetical protein MAPG_02045 [Magnaporthiopsis poae ATCC 64411]